MFCSICRESLNNPTSLPCGHAFCRGCIQQWFKSIKRRECPYHCEKARNCPRENVVRLFLDGTTSHSDEVLSFVSAENNDSGATAATLSLSTSFAAVTVDDDDFVPERPVTRSQTNGQGRGRGNSNATDSISNGQGRGNYRGRGRGRGRPRGSRIGGRPATVAETRQLGTQPSIPGPIRRRQQQNNRGNILLKF